MVEDEDDSKAGDQDDDQGTVHVGHVLHKSLPQAGDVVVSFSPGLAGLDTVEESLEVGGKW